MSTSKEKLESYHHGDLRAAIIHNGLKQVRERGASSLGLRQLAAESGVSATAIYRHFKDLDHIKAALGQAAREELGRSMLESINQRSYSRKTKSGAIARLEIMGNAYIDYGVRNFHLLELAFAVFDSPPLLPDSPDPWEILNEALTDLCETGALTKKNMKTAPAIVWSLVHGYTVLTALNPEGPDERARVDRKSIINSIFKALEITH